VNFQKGERQMNMDYALNEALKYTTNLETPGVILAYDINCQYSINLRRRLADGPYLDNREDLPILPAIGLFHVHGHQEKCYARYAPTFVRGMGKGDGEILETNWSVLNGISSMTRTMTLSHRSEVMDAHIGDNNWKKMINMCKLACFSFPRGLTMSSKSSWLATSLCARWKKTCLTKAEHVEDFELMDENASAGNRSAWERLVEHADRTRLSDVSVMDIYNVKVPNGTPDFEPQLAGFMHFQSFPGGRSRPNSWRQSFLQTVASGLQAG
jgi:Kyakuja-Dileera-Zisupton transposase